MIARNLRVAAHLWSSATAFFFVAFLFAYFYLRALDQNHLWHPHQVKAPVTTGTLIAVAVAASGIAAVLAARRLRAGDESGWRALGLGALALGLVAVVIQIVEWSSLGFGPTDGGYASVFLGWTGLYLLFLIGSLYWLETLLATSFRHRGGGAGIRDPGRARGRRVRLLLGRALAGSASRPGSSSTCCRCRSCFAGRTGRCSGRSTRWR